MQILPLLCICKKTRIVYYIVISLKRPVQNCCSKSHLSTKSVLKGMKNSASLKRWQLTLKCKQTTFNFCCNFERFSVLTVGNRNVKIARFVRTVCMRRIRWSCEGLTSVHNEYTEYTLKHLLLRHMYNLALLNLCAMCSSLATLRLPTVDLY